MVKAFESIFELHPNELFVPEYYASMGAVGAAECGVYRRRGGGTDDYQVGPQAPVELPELPGDILVRQEDGVGAGAPGGVQPELADVGGDYAPSALRLGGRDVQEPGDS